MEIGNEKDVIAMDCKMCEKKDPKSDKADSSEDTMPDTHDSVNDALVSLRCCIAYKDDNGQVKEVIRTPRTKQWREVTLRLVTYLF
jgi:hypothetical protein